MAVRREERIEDERANLLVDDSGRVWRYLRSRAHCRVAIVADNAGTELLADIALADFLLTTRLAEQVVLHVKAHPFFVSDAMAKDVAAGVDLQVLTHWFHTTSLFYPDLPADLREDLAGMDVVVLKGDANYRRLLSDAHWPPTTPFEGATAYFPAPIVALRTFKSEIVVGLDAGVAERMQEQDPHWLVNGRRGVVQAKLPDR